MKALLLSAAILVCTIQDATAQRRGRMINRRFNAGLILGGNAAQIDGDRHQGFDQFGVYAGAKGVVNFNRQLLLMVEFLYSQKGSKFDQDIGAFSASHNTSIRLNYIETPLLVQYRFKDTENSFYIEGGISYARLINQAISEPPDIRGVRLSYSSLSPSFRNNDINILAGAGFELKPRIGFALRYSLAANRFYYNQTYDPFENTATQLRVMRNYHLSFLMTYRIFKLNM